jgi:hypothetical protein
VRVQGRTSVRSVAGSEADDSENAWATLVGTLARFCWYLGFLALPAALFGLGAAHSGALSGVYLLLLLAGFAPATLRLAPQVGHKILIFLYIVKESKINCNI